MTDDSSIHVQGIHLKTAFEAFTDIPLDLQLHGPEGVLTIAANATLRYLSTINTSCVPLRLIAGAPLEVYSEHATTCEWLLGILAHEQTETIQGPESWWDHPSTQSHVGYLLGIGNNEGKDTGDQTRFTELLIYATTVEQSSTEATLPTPPPSSPRSDDVAGQAIAHPSPSIVFRALPICSNLPRLVGQSACLSTAEQDLRTVDIDLQPPLPETESKHGKRRALTTVFAEASRERKRLKRRGGESIGTFVREPEGDKSRAVADHVHAISASKIDDGDAGGGIVRPSSSRHFRSSSITSIATEVPPKLHKQLPSQGDVPQMAPEGQNTATAGPKNPPEQIEQQNKALLSRTVMAGMRLHGLQQPRKSIQRTTSLPTAIPPANPSDDTANEEYRQIYHHTYKAAAFALRHQMYTQILKGGDVRETVDRLLGIFLSGTTAVEDHAGDLREGFG